MAALAPVPFADLVRRMRSELHTSDSIFDLPRRKWFTPDGRFDFSATHFGRRAGTPVGPAAGPHTQLAQNIVLSWLAGARILELKTVQINDRLEIPRPCIHVPNVGYNVEWSQELRVRESLMEYAKAAYLVEILRATRVFGSMAEAAGFDAAADTIYDISVGYDLAGIRSDKVTGFLQGMQNSGALFDELRAKLDGDLAAYRDLELPAAISGCVTLSTFHGCPAHEIEAISRHLIAEAGLDTIVKLNPTLLGFEAAQEILHDRLGYTHLELRRDAFDADLQYDDGLEMLARLHDLAGEHGTEIGAKFTNTLVVANDPAIFPTQSDPYMYLSGPPLHVLSMTLMQRFRTDLGLDIPISFSAGVNARNFPAAVACGMVPVTTCTDLLRQGGYGRLPGYLRALGLEMERLGVSSREEYVLAAGGHGEQARANAAAANLDTEATALLATRIAGRLNGPAIVAALPEERAYQAAANAREPRRIESKLGLYDCINCDLCIPACPNDAVFFYETTPRSVNTERLGSGSATDGRPVSVGAGELARATGAGYTVRESHQLAVLEAACNECSNCEVYCPEEGAPFEIKERLFLSPDAFKASTQDGFCREGDLLHARVDGLDMRMVPEPGKNRATVSCDHFHLVLEWESLSLARGHFGGAPLEIDTAVLWRLKTIWESIYSGERASMLRPEPR